MSLIYEPSFGVRGVRFARADAACDHDREGEREWVWVRVCEREKMCEREREERDWGSRFARADAACDHDQLARLDVQVDVCRGVAC